VRVGAAQSCEPKQEADKRCVFSCYDFSGKKVGNEP